MSTPTPKSVEEVLKSLDPNRTFDSLREPADIFALTSSLLASGYYREALSPRDGKIWSPIRSEEIENETSSWVDWREKGLQPEDKPKWLLDSLQKLEERKSDTIAQELDWPSILRLHAIADEVCGKLMATLKAEMSLRQAGSLSTFDTSRVTVLPKHRAPQSGATLRSFSRYAAVGKSEVKIKWNAIYWLADNDSPINLLLLPWPLKVRSADFKPVAEEPIKMDRDFGFFQFKPSESVEVDEVRRWLIQAQAEGEVHSVVLPECALTAREADSLAGLCDENEILFIGGVGEDESGPVNYAHLSHFRMRSRPQKQHKHHRWQLDRNQILDYGLGSRLGGGRKWWEAIPISGRELTFLELGADIVIAVLICEDLARIEPVSELIRAVGPTLVIALLLDGPQLGARWSARYATVLAEDPGSSVLTLTSLGMVERSRPPGKPPSRVCALFKDPSGSAHELALEENSGAMILSLHPERVESWCADGRKHQTVILRYGGHQSIKSPDRGQ